MIAGFARVEIAAEDAAAERAAWARFLGLAPADAGDFRLANIAVRVRSAAAGEASGLSGLVFHVDDPAEAARRLERRGLLVEPEGQEVRLGGEACHGLPLALSRTRPRLEPAQAADALVALDHVVVRTADAERAIALFAGRLGLDLRLERANPAWGARLLFFRCGDAVVEASAPVEGAAGSGPDVLSGLAFRAADPDAARARLAAEGFDVSKVRAGRKPGTRVFTLRSGLAYGPALVIGPADAA